MTRRYAINLPLERKKEAEGLANQQGVSLNQFILWSVAEKVSSLKDSLDDSNYPGLHTAVAPRASQCQYCAGPVSASRRL
jgi:hypothetical protein